MPILVIAEHDNLALKDATLHTVTAALQLTTKEVVVLVAGNNCSAVSRQAATLQGVSQVLYVDHAAYKHQLAEKLAALVQELAGDFSCILAAATTFGKNVTPRIAALLDVVQVSDIIQIIAHDTFMRPIYAGNALETVRVLDAKKVITVRATAFAPCGLQAAPCDIKTVSSNTAAKDLNLSEFVSLDAVANVRPELTQAKIVVAGGRGFQSKENFQLLEKLADKLGAAIGASRAAVDAGYIENDHQVGQTGKIVAPNLYIAIGISGAIQHVAGMKDSKVIVAINKDPDAPIFKIADYGLVGDLFVVIPELIAKL